jgi:hypothetical protein
MTLITALQLTAHEQDFLGGLPRLHSVEHVQEGCKSKKSKRAYGPDFDMSSG